jgi:hypothetical protein
MFSCRCPNSHISAAIVLSLAGSVQKQMASESASVGSCHIVAGHLGMAENQNGQALDNGPSFSTHGKRARDGSVSISPRDLGRGVDVRLSETKGCRQEVGVRLAVRQAEDLSWARVDFGWRT